MNTLKNVISFSAVAFALISRAQGAELSKPPPAADSNSASPKATLRAAAMPVRPALRPSRSQVSVADSPDQPTQPETGTGGKDTGSDTGSQSDSDREKPELPTRPAAAITDEIKQFTEDMKQARMEFLQHQQELRRELRGATDEERDSIRSRLKEDRQFFLGEQQEARQTFRQQLDQLKEKLRAHQELLQEIQSEAREKVRRKEGGF